MHDMLHVMKLFSLFALVALQKQSFLKKKKGESIEIVSKDQLEFNIYWAIFIYC